MAITFCGETWAKPTAAYQIRACAAPGISLHPLQLVRPSLPRHLTLGTSRHQVSARQMQNFALTYFHPGWAQAMNLSYYLAHHPRCPSCGSPAIHRSRRKGFRESLLRWVFFISPYRCHDCNYRHFRLSFHTPRHPGNAATK